MTNDEEFQRLRRTETPPTQAREVTARWWFERGVEFARRTYEARIDGLLVDRERPEAALAELRNSIVDPADVCRVFSAWVDLNKEFREPQLTRLRDAILAADALTLVVEALAALGDPAENSPESLTACRARRDALTPAQEKQ